MGLINDSYPNLNTAFKCAASRWYLFAAAGGCLRPGCRLLRPQGHPGRRSHIFAVRIKFRQSTATGRGVRDGGSVHSPLTRARSDRRSRSVRRLKVGRHVTWRVLTPAPRDVLRAPLRLLLQFVYKKHKIICRKAKLSETDFLKDFINVLKFFYCLAPINYM
ncbi:hypothetical protein K1T71_003048 [Dendrolimus kikuchii]|uniref:Uncharacterized protein n=1 Tax=Dendrolimus kikuchii TaxID=765133 RepID=A0ACC1DAL0_9NEOP|nr:hypothetical protein K1T71_003048 [Dendrolimus kikuchii]